MTPAKTLFPKVTLTGSRDQGMDIYLGKTPFNPLQIHRKLLVIPKFRLNWASCCLSGNRTEVLSLSLSWLLCPCWAGPPGPEKQGEGRVWGGGQQHLCELSAVSAGELGAGPRMWGWASTASLPTDTWERKALARPLHG